MKGKVAVITGAASGIGSATASVLAARGCSLVLVDVDDAGLARTRADLPDTTQVMLSVADVSHEREVERVFVEARERFGALHLLHNNAGILGDFALLAETSAAAYDRVLSVNARGAFLSLRAFFRLVGAQATGGAVVNMSSVAALRGSQDLVAYAMSKSAIIGLTRVGAVEGKPLGIRVNAVCPGRIDTPMTLDRADELRPLADRHGSALEVAYLVAWLLSDEASFVTGAAYPVDGGLTA